MMALVNKFDGDCVEISPFDVLHVVERQGLRFYDLTLKGEIGYYKNVVKDSGYDSHQKTFTGHHRFQGANLFPSGGYLDANLGNIIVKVEFENDEFLLVPGICYLMLMNEQIKLFGKIIVNTTLSHELKKLPITASFIYDDMTVSAAVTVTSPLLVHRNMRFCEISFVDSGLSFNGDSGAY